MLVPVFSVRESVIHNISARVSACRNVGLTSECRIDIGSISVTFLNDAILHNIAQYFSSCFFRQRKV